MALMNYQLTWESLDSNIQQEQCFYDFENQSEVTDALFGFFADSDNSSCLPLDSLFNTTYDKTYNNEDYYMFPHCYATHHTSYSAPSLLSLPPDLYSPSDEFDICQSRKRPRSYNDLYHSTNDFILDDISCNAEHSVVAPNDALPINYQIPDFLTDFAAQPPPIVCNGERKGNNGCLSAQSIAARERRKRISEKTLELGKLIPGGNKMNTAEMFQAAYKYVKFLQAQIAVFKLMDSIKDCGVPEQVHDRLQVLVTSSVMQEKLYGEGKCVVPKEAIEVITKDKDMKLNHFVSRDLDRFIESLG